MSHDSKIQFSGPSSLAVHAGNRTCPVTGGVVTPISPASACLHPNPAGGETSYPRYHTLPTQLAAAEKLAALEGADAALTFASGMGAIAAVLLGLPKAGDHVVLQADIYGGSHKLAAKELPRLGIRTTFVADTRAEAILAAVTPETKLIYLESPTNPLLRVVDLAAVAQKARAKGILTACDNTFATPVNQRPLHLPGGGVDVVIHSATKYLNGHSDLNCGIVTGPAQLMARISEISRSLGATLNGLDAYLLERGMKTLAVRMARHNENGMRVARFLAEHPMVAAVHYPGLPEHPDHETAKRQLAGPGAGYSGMLAFELDPTQCDLARARRMVAALRMIHGAVSLGGVESLICFPAETSHAAMDPAARAAIGVTDTLLRLSVGIEEPQDIIADLEQALSTP